MQLLWSRNAIMGYLFGIPPLLLKMLGVINTWWLPITLCSVIAGLLVAHYLIPESHTSTILKEYTAQELTDLFRQSIQYFDKSSVSAHTKEMIKHLNDNCEAVLIQYRAEEQTHKSVLSPEQKNVMRRLVVEYLPELLQQYQAIPKNMLNKKIRDNETVSSLFDENLSKLIDMSNQILDKMTQHSFAQLDANNEFLKQKINTDNKLIIDEKTS